MAARLGALKSVLNPVCGDFRPVTAGQTGRSTGGSDGTGGLDVDGSEELCSIYGSSPPSLADIPDSPGNIKSTWHGVNS